MRFEARHIVVLVLILGALWFVYQQIKKGGIKMPSQMQGA